MPRTVPADFQASEQKPFRRFARLFKVTLASMNVVLRYAEKDISVAGRDGSGVDVGDGAGKQVWSAAPGISRDAAEQRMDLQVDKMQVVIPSTNDAKITLANLGPMTVAQLAVRRVFDNATVDTYVYDYDSDTVVPWLTFYVQGAIGWSYDSVTFALESIFSKMDIQTPRTILEEACNNKLGDVWCTINLSLYRCTATVLASPVPTRTVFAVSITSFGAKAPNPMRADFFDLGKAKFTSGTNAPADGMVLTQTSALLITMADAFPVAPQAGNVLTLDPGCDKTAAMCQAVFDNLLNFRGYLYIPPDEVVYPI